MVTLTAIADAPMAPSASAIADAPSAIAASAAAAAAVVQAQMMAAPRGYTIDEERKQHLLSLMEEGKKTGKRMPCCNKSCLLESDSSHICVVGGGYACGMCRGLNADGSDLDNLRSLIVCLTCDKSNEDTTDKKSTKKKSSANEIKKQQMLQWVDTLDTSHIQLTPDENDVQQLGGIDWGKLSADIMKKFMKNNNISKPNNMRTKNKLGECVANHMKAQGYKNSLTSAHRKKSKATTKPDCLTEDGTMFRIANTIAEQKDAFIETKNSHDQGDQDTRRAKAIAWETMQKHYASDTVSLNKLSAVSYEALLGHGVPSNVCTDIDYLDVDEFQACVLYLLAHYREACNNKTKSGNHQPFSDYVGGKTWLLYFHHVLLELGDKDLSNCAYPRLDDDIMRTSDKRHPKLNKSNRTDRRSPISERSISASPTMSLSLRNGKQAAVNATAYAAASIESKNEEQLRNDGFDRMMKIKDKEEETAQMYSALKKKRKSCKRKIRSGDAPQSDLTAINTKLKSVKTKQRMYAAECARLKETIGYESPDVSDVSDSDDSVESNSNASEEEEIET